MASGVEKAVVGQVPLFAALPDEVRDGLAALVEHRHYRRGDVVLRQGEIGEEVYVVLAGALKISRQFADARESVVAVLGPGDLIGELALFDPGPRSASAVAVGDLELARLGNGPLLAWLREHPEVAEGLLKALAQRVRKLNASRDDLVVTDVPGRVAKALLDLTRRFGRPLADPPGAQRVRHGLTQEELAQLVGASRETVNKALAEFVSRGWLRLQTRGAVLLDPAALATRAGEGDAELPAAVEGTSG